MGREKKFSELYLIDTGYCAAALVMVGALFASGGEIRNTGAVQ